MQRVKKNKKEILFEKKYWELCFEQYTNHCALRAILLNLGLLTISGKTQTRWWVEGGASAEAEAD